MKLLTEQIKKTIPKLRSQEGKGGDAIVHVKFFTPDSNWTWYVTEGESQKDIDEKEINFLFFGLVDGFVKEFGYFDLVQLQQARSPMGLSIERDMYWTPKTLKEIAPELFR